MTQQNKNLAELTNIVGPENVLTDHSALMHYGKDWTPHYHPSPLAIVFPRDTAQVQALVAMANPRRLALVPSGGRTGLSGGAVAANNEVVVSFEKMNKIKSFNAVARTLVCEAGVVTRQLQQFALDQGFYYPVDFASSGSSQIGGNIATNAGGIKVIRYGMTRDWIAGLEVVTGKGERLELNRSLVKNASGYDLRHLFIGSEGTLGFITQATVWLTDKPQSLAVMVLAVSHLDNLMLVAEAFRKELVLTALEFFSDKSLQQVLAHRGLQPPCGKDAPYYLLIEFEQGNEQVSQTAMNVFSESMERGWVIDAVMSQSEIQALKLWQLREGIAESVASRMPYKNDLSVAIDRVPEFLSSMDRVLTKEYPDFEVLWFGHIGDGNVHINVLRPDHMSEHDFVAKCAGVNQEVFSQVRRFGGSISAEHGVGLLKRDYLGYSRSEEEIAYLRQLKTVFDPNNIMNPGKLL